MITADKIDSDGHRRVRVEPATHEAPKFEGWNCFFVGFVGAKRPGDKSHTTFSYMNDEDYAAYRERRRERLAARAV